MGYFTHQHNSSRDCTTMEAQSLQGIAIGHSDDSNGMMFFCSFNKEVYTTAQYHLDESGYTANDFNLIYNSGIFNGLYSSQSKLKSKTSLPTEQYLPGTEVSFVKSDGVHICGSVIAVPLVVPLFKSSCDSRTHYTICLIGGSIKQVSLATMATIIRASAQHPTLQLSQLVLPPWIDNSKKVTFEIDGKRQL
eukprot:14507280-Ditylum_brightwellii.AAC.1